jgi:EAL domain-containing protein (putative c-di-GMP-specific phosphodiesterase class I)
MNFIRLDGRYYRDRAVSKFKFVKLLATYCKVDNISLCAQYVDTPEDKNWLLKNGVRYLQGQAIEPIKATVKTALNAGPVKASSFNKLKQTNAAEDALISAKSLEGRDLANLEKI